MRHGLGKDRSSGFRSYLSSASLGLKRISMRHGSAEGFLRKPNGRAQQPCPSRRLFLLLQPAILPRILPTTNVDSAKGARLPRRNLPPLQGDITACAEIPGFGVAWWGIATVQ